MDAMTFAIAEAREEELISQREVLDAQLRVLQRMISEYRDANPPPKDIREAFSTKRSARLPEMRAAVAAIMYAANTPMLTGEIIAHLAERGLINGNRENDRAYARATLQRLKDLIVSDGRCRWWLIPPP